MTLFLDLKSLEAREWRRMSIQFSQGGYGGKHVRRFGSRGRVIATAVDKNKAGVPSLPWNFIQQPFMGIFHRFLGDQFCPTTFSFLFFPFYFVCCFLFLFLCFSTPLWLFVFFSFQCFFPPPVFEPFSLFFTVPIFCVFWAKRFSIPSCVRDFPL